MLHHRNKRPYVFDDKLKPGLSDQVLMWIGGTLSAVIVTALLIVVCCI